MTDAAAAPTAPGRGSHFVGRQQELAVLRARLDDALAGQGSLVLLVGEPGIGKTRTAAEFAEHARGCGALVLWGTVFEGDWQPPYGPWATALGEYVRALDREQLARQLGQSVSLLAPLVPEVRAALPGTPPPEPVGPDEARFRLLDAITQFLLAASREQPIVLVLDDLHWDVGVPAGQRPMYAGPGDLVYKPRNVWHTFWNASDEPARLLEIISPAGFEQFFVELGELVSSGQADAAMLASLNTKYGVQVDSGSVAQLVGEHCLIATRDEGVPTTANEVANAVLSY